MKFLKYHNIFWLVYFLLYYIGPIRYVVKSETFFLLISMVIFGNIAYLLGYNFASKNIIIKPFNIGNRHIIKEYRFLILGTVLYLIFLSIKYIQLQNTYGFSFTLEGFTDFRSNVVMETLGDNIFGVASSILSGFPALLIAFLIYNHNRLLKRQKSNIIIILIFSIISTFSSGGRNASFILILVYFVSSALLKSQLPKVNFKTKSYIIIALLSIIFVFSKIFIDRAVQTSGDLGIYIEYFEETKGFEIKPYALSLIADSNLNSFFFPIFMFIDYFVHSLNDFEITINSSPKNFPYWGSYQFGNFTLLLSKIGLESISINEILSEIPNPGKYLTLFGGVYYDFGLFGTYIFIFIIYYLTGYYIRKFYLNSKYSDLIWFIYFYIIILMSPIYDVISVAIYPSFFVVILLNLIFRKFIIFK